MRRLYWLVLGLSVTLFAWCLLAVTAQAEETVVDWWELTHVE